MAWNENSPRGRDPWGNNGNKPNGPPDFDELLKRFKDRLGRRSGGNLPTNGKSYFGLGFGVIALLWILSGFYQVDEQERAVVFRLGAYVGTAEPGLRWRMPWPIERHQTVNFTNVHSVGEKAKMLTQDENIISVELSVQYKLSSARDYLVNVEKPDDSLRQAMLASVREVVGQNTMDFILTEGRTAVAAKTKELLQERMEEYKTGLVVTEINLKQVQPPEEVRAAFDDAIKAREDLERQKNEAQAYANDRLPRARGAAARQMAEANGYREQIIAKATGDAARFDSVVNEYRKAPGVTKDRMYFETMSDVYSRTSKVIVDVDKSNPTFYLPLDQIMKPRTAKVPEPEFYADTPSAAPAPAPKAADNGRSRDRGVR